MALPVSAERVTYDSVDLTEEEIAKYAQSPDDTVIKLYSYGTPYGNFARKYPYEDWFSMKTHWMFFSGAPFYLSVSPTGELVYTYALEESTEPDRIYGNWSDWSDLVPYILDPSLILGEDIHVYHIYCINSEILAENGGHFAFQNGVYVCYVTEEGEFYLHKPESHWDGLYMMYEDEFVEYMRIMSAWVQDFGLHQIAWGVSGPDKVFDLEPYRLENFKHPYEDTPDEGGDAPVTPEDPPAEGGDTGTTPEENGNGGAQQSDPPAEAHPWKNVLIYTAVGVVAFACGCGGTVAIVFYRKRRGK